MQEECDSGCSNNLRGRLLLKQVGGKESVVTMAIVIAISIVLAAITKLLSLLRF